MMNLYSIIIPAIRGTGADCHVGNVSAEVVNGKAMAVDQAPSASWLPMTKTASPGRVLLHRTLKTADAVAALMEPS